MQVKYLTFCFLSLLFLFKSENYCMLGSMFINPFGNSQNNQNHSCCRNAFCCENPLMSTLTYGLLGSLGAPIIAGIIRIILQTRFKRLIGRRIRARKKEVKKYGIIKDINLYDVVDEMKKEISSNVIGQEVAIQHLLDTFEIFLENNNQCMALILDGVSGVGKNLSLSIVLKHILDK